MKRLMLSVVGLVILVTGIYIYDYTGPAQEEAQDVADKLPTVALLQLTSHPSLDAIAEGVVDKLGEYGYVDGETMHLDFQNAQGDQSNLNQMSAKFVGERADLMIGIATPAGQALANASADIPIILGAVTDPENVGLVASNQHPNGNVTGVSDMTPIAEQLALIRQILPDAKTLGIMYSSSEDNSVTQGKLAESLAADYDFETVVKTVTSTNDVSQVGQQLVKEVDAVWVPNDNVIASAFPSLLQQSDAEGIPIFPAVDVMVTQGGLATLGLNQYQLGLMTGEMAAQVLKGEINPATEPIRQGKQTDLIINFEKAEQLGINLPKKLSEKAIPVDHTEKEE